jgi:tripartite-type tricarboxylate transporter receptor subunit TctC
LVARLNAEMGKAIADPAVREALAKGAVEPVGGSAEELGTLARADSEKYARLVKELNIGTN